MSDCTSLVAEAFGSGRVRSGLAAAAAGGQLGVGAGAGRGGNHRAEGEVPGATGLGREDALGDG